MSQVTVLFFIIVSLSTIAYGQISFSTNWGSGKRSPPYNSRPVILDTCITQTDPELLYDMVKLIQKQAEKLLECMEQAKRTMSHR